VRYLVAEGNFVISPVEKDLSGPSKKENKKEM
jgi:hypothetical protein